MVWRGHSYRPRVRYRFMQTPFHKEEEARLDNASQGLNLYHAECHELEIGQGPCSSRGSPDGDVPKVLQKTSYCAVWEFALPYPH
jgi:hypothetical protein